MTHSRFRRRSATFQAAAANLNPWTEAKVDTRTPNGLTLSDVSGRKDPSCHGQSRTLV